MTMKNYLLFCPAYIRRLAVLIADNIRQPCSETEISEQV